MAHVWVPLPDTDFDVTEVAVPWKLLMRAGHRVTFVTETGEVTPAADKLLITGVLFGQLGAEPEPKRFYEELTRAPEFTRPVSWKTLDVTAFDALLLPGGHAPGMKQYLGSEALRAKVRAFCELKRPAGAICHGVLVAARANVLRGKKTTCLPAYMERVAYWGTLPPTPSEPPLPPLDAMVQSRAWLVANELQLKQDLALGAGPSIEDLAGIAGIEPERRAHFGRVLQRHRQELLAPHELTPQQAAAVRARVGALVMGDPLLRIDGEAVLAER